MQSYRFTEPSVPGTAVLAATMFFLPLAGFFIHRCNRFWGWLRVDPDGILVRTLISRRYLAFDRIVSVSIAGGKGGHELVILTEDRPEETDILTYHLDEDDEERFMQIVKAGLHDLLERQEAVWDQGEMACEFSPRAMREGWYLVTVINGMAWVLIGSLIWSYSARPVLIAVLIAGAVAILGLTVMIHQRYFSQRYSLTPTGLRIWSVLGNQFLAYPSIRSIYLTRRRLYGAHSVRCLITASPGRGLWPEGRFWLSSSMRNFEGFVSRLVQRASNASVRGALPADATEQTRILRVRALNAIRFWFVASLVIAVVLVVGGISSLQERFHLIHQGGKVWAQVIKKAQGSSGSRIYYEFRVETPHMGHGVFPGQARVLRRDYHRYAVSDWVEVLYDPHNPYSNLYRPDISQRFSWMFIAMGFVLLIYAAHQMKLLHLARQEARQARGRSSPPKASRGLSSHTADRSAGPIRP
jgi:hypothetical protein